MYIIDAHANESVNIPIVYMITFYQFIDRIVDKGF